MTERQDSFTVAPHHPALPGHFPGRPIVPGVVLAEEALVRVAGGRRLLSLDSAKFHASLLPGETCELRWQEDGGERTAVRCLRGGRVIAEMLFRWQPRTATP